MKIKAIFTVIIIFICMILYGFFAVNKRIGPEFAVNIDLANPVAIQWPCEISIVGDNGEKGLRIAPKIGRGWRGEAGGKADYRFFIPNDGKYHIWAYCLWFDECANAIFAQIDNNEKAIIGNDPIYNKWHWVRGFDIFLKKGTHNLVLSNHSDHISLQKIAFSNSQSLPQKTELVFSDMFYDGFDGCDQGNFTSWKQVKGNWIVQNPDSAKCLIENSLIGKSKDKAFITYQNNDWQNYSLDISIKVSSQDLKNGSVGICFGLTGQNNYYQLKIQPDKNEKYAKIAILDSNSKVISEFDYDFKFDKWQQFQIALKGKSIEVICNEKQPVKIQTDKEIKGGIGLMLEGRIKAYFDNIHVRKITHNQIKE